MAVSVVWVLQQRVRSIHYWLLDNHLLTLQGVKEQVLAEIVKKFQLNDGSPSAPMVWKAFKVYMHGLLISLKISRLRSVLNTGIFWYNKLKV